MATLTITVPDAAVPRIRAAFGAAGAPATVAGVQDAVRDFIRQRVVSFETLAALQAASDLVTKNTEVWA
jgi:hypothetical protein